MAETNAPPILIPEPFMRDGQLRGWTQELHSFLYLLWVRSGGGDDNFIPTKEAIDAINAAIAVLQAELNQAELDIDALEAAVAALQLAVISLQSAVDVLNVDVAQLQAEMLDRTRWLNLWTAGTYERSDQVRDGAWTMIANKQTTDRAAPQASGPEFGFYEGTMATTSALAKVVIFGNRYTINNSGYIKGYRVYTFAGITYEVFSIVDPLGANIVDRLATFSATTTGWRNFTIDSIIVQAGAVLDISAVANEPDPTPTPTTVSYNYVNPQNPSPPISGEIQQSRGQPDLMSVSYTDAVAGDRTALIQGLSAGDTIEGAGLIWTILANIAQATYADLTVSPAATGSPIGVQDFLFNTTTPTDISYSLDTDYWLTSTHSAQGLLAIDSDYNSITPNNTAYGTDITVQNAVISPDWDVVAQSVSGAGSSDPTIDPIASTLDPNFINASAVLSEGNLRITYNSAFAAPSSARSTTSHSTGKWVFEVSNAANATDTTNQSWVGICLAGQQIDNIPGGDFEVPPGDSELGYSVQYGNHAVGSRSWKWHLSLREDIIPPHDWTLAGEHIMMLIDLNAGTISYISEVQGTEELLYSGVASNEWFACIAGGGSAADQTINFGDTPFTNTIPPGQGWQAWNA